MSGAVDYTNQLRNGESKIEELWKEEEQHRLAEGAQDTSDRKSHSCKVCVRVPNEDLGRVPVKESL